MIDVHFLILFLFIHENIRLPQSSDDIFNVRYRYWNYKNVELKFKAHKFNDEYLFILWKINIAAYFRVYFKVRGSGGKIELDGLASKKNPWSCIHLKGEICTRDTRSASSSLVHYNAGWAYLHRQHNSALHVSRRTHNGRIIIFNWINLNRIIPINPRPNASLRCTRVGKIALQTHELLRTSGGGWGTGR